MAFTLGTFACSATSIFIAQEHNWKLPSVLLPTVRCWLGGRKGIRPVSCFTKIQIGFTFLVPAHLGIPGKWPLNVCKCKCKKLTWKLQCE